MRSITVRNPLKRDNRIIIGIAGDVPLLTDYQQGFVDGKSEGKVLGLQPLGVLAGIGIFYGYQYAKKTGKL